MEQTSAQKIEAEISEKLEAAFESVVKTKNEYYQNNPQEIPKRNSENSLISSVALTNSAISGGSSLIPGPWGMLAVVPELMLVIRNQIGLIYDIAAANGKKDLMTKELAAMVFVSAMGTSAGGLIVVHGGTYLVKRASLQVFQKIVVILGGKITQQALKSAISKWLPGVGAAAMAAWTNYMTRQIGQKASEIFSSEIQFEDSIVDIELSKPIEGVSDLEFDILQSSLCEQEALISKNQYEETKVFGDLSNKALTKKQIREINELKNAHVQGFLSDDDLGKRIKTVIQLAAA